MAVFNAGGKVWAGHRLSLPAGSGATELCLTDRRWQMPQGGIEAGEDPFDAAKRELFEETGIKNAEFLSALEKPLFYDLPEALLGKALKGKYRGQKMHWFAFRFTGSDDEINIAEPPDGAPIEFDEWQWVELADLPDMVVPFKRQLYTEVVTAFSGIG